MRTINVQTRLPMSAFVIGLLEKIISKLASGRILASWLVLVLPEDRFSCDKAHVI